MKGIVTKGYPDSDPKPPTFQVPKMQVLNLIRPFWGWGFRYISLTQSRYRRVPPVQVPDFFKQYLPFLELAIVYKIF